jgi:hypothetical protein
MRRCIPPDETNRETTISGSSSSTRAGNVKTSYVPIYIYIYYRDEKLQTWQAEATNQLSSPTFQLDVHTKARNIL